MVYFICGDFLFTWIGFTTDDERKREDRHDAGIAGSEKPGGEKMKGTVDSRV